MDAVKEYLQNEADERGLDAEVEEFTEQRGNRTVSGHRVTVTKNGEDRKFEVVHYTEREVDDFFESSVNTAFDELEEAL